MNKLAGGHKIVSSDIISPYLRDFRSTTVSEAKPEWSTTQVVLWPGPCLLESFFSQQSEMRKAKHDDPRYDVKVQPEFS